MMDNNQDENDEQISLFVSFVYLKIRSCNHNTLAC